MLCIIPISEIKKKKQKNTLQLVKNNQDPQMDWILERLLDNSEDSNILGVLPTCLS